jgi:hypothetical protein
MVQGVFRSSLSLGATKTMRYIKYVTDNPYRLLQISSCVTPKELRKAASRADKAVQVNQFVGAGLESIFGSTEISHCPEIVSSLTNDPKQRTFYRLFWPFLYERPQDANGTLEDLQRLIDRYANPNIFHVTHLCFLKQWFEYLDHQTPSAARMAFLGFQDLYDDIACDEYLLELLQKEDADAECLHAVQEEVIAHLLDTVCRQAVEFWEAGSMAQAVGLLAVVCFSPFDIEAIHHALRPVSELGERERQKIRDAMKAYNWMPRQGVQEITETQNLKQLAQCVGKHLAVAGLWRQTVDERVEQVANSMRNYAIDLANEKEDWRGCRTILMQMHTLSLPGEWNKTLHNDLETLAANEKAAERQRLYKAIQPIKAAPSLQTFNGIGTKMYGREPFDAERGAYLSTLYFVFAFIPIFPIARYLVRDASNGGWHFQGKAAWSLGNKIHLSVSLALLIGLIGLIAWSNYTESHSNSNYTAYSATTAPVTGVPTPPSSTPLVPEPPVLPHIVTQVPAPSLSMSVAPAPSTPVAVTQREYTPAPASLSSSAAQLDNAREEHRDKLRAEEKQLTEGIRESDAKLAAMKQQVEEGRARLHEAGQEVDQARQNLQKARENVDAQRVILDTSDDIALTAFNARVTQYNQDKDAFNAQVEHYEADRQRFNDTVDAYNEAIRLNNADVARLNEVVHALEDLKL